ncbi:MAG: YraN family protein [Steroidobacteraceae bacterium]
MGGNPPRRGAAPRSELIALAATERQLAGQRGEQLAALHLEQAGLHILMCNYRRRRTEIDIVAEDGEDLVIVEVRLRSSRRFGGGAGSVDARKRRHLVVAAMQLLQQYPQFRRRRLRFDVVSLEPGECGHQIEWIRHAFTADGV